MSKKIIIKILRVLFELIVVFGFFLLGCIYLYYNSSSWKKSDIMSEYEVSKCIKKMQNIKY